MPCVLLPPVVAHRVARFILRPTPVPRRIHCAELSEVMPVVGVRAAIFSNALLVWIVKRSVMPGRGCSTLPRACHVEVLSSFCHRSDRQHQGISSDSSRALRKTEPSFQPSLTNHRGNWAWSSGRSQRRDYGVDRSAVIAQDEAVLRKSSILILVAAVRLWLSGSP